MIAPWILIAACYALTLVGTLGLTLWTWAAMRRAEAAAAKLGKRP